MASRPSALRSNAQNRYLWGVVYATIETAAHERGMKTAKGRKITAAHLHQWAKLRFAVMAIKLDAEETGRKVEPGELVHPSTSTMTKGAHGYFVRFLQEHFAGLGIDVPDPHEEELLAVYGPKINQRIRKCLNTK